MERQRPAKRRVRQPDPAVLGRHARLSVSDLVKWDAARHGKTAQEIHLGTDVDADQNEQGGSGRLRFRLAGRQSEWPSSDCSRRRHPRFSTQISRFPDDKLTVIVLTNSGNGDAGALAQGIAGRTLPVLAKKAEEPIADNDPQATERFKGLLLRAIKGEADPELFTEEAKKALVPRIREGKAMFAPFGALKAFQLLERKTTGEGMQLRYRTIFENETLNTTFVLDKAGKIAGLAIRPAE